MENIFNKEETLHLVHLFPYGAKDFTNTIKRFKLFLLSILQSLIFLYSFAVIISLYLFLVRVNIISQIPSNLLNVFRRGEIIPVIPPEPIYIEKTKFKTRRRPHLKRKQM